MDFIHTGSAAGLEISMQAYRQAHHRVAQRHARAAAKGNYSAVKVVVGSILGFVLIVVLFTTTLKIGRAHV